ncbi:MAG: hydroxymethylpyrimidine/phosphomethylpyrimidine kinase [Pseudomonadota bacterium]
MCSYATPSRSNAAQPPVVLAIGGHDPSGGAGIQADIETIAALGGHAVTVVTALTVQDTQDVRQLRAVDAGFVRAQLEALFDDFPLRTAKLGLAGSVEAVQEVARLLKLHSGVRLVLDPVLAAGGGRELSNAELRDALLDLLLPRTFLATPNSRELQRLSGESDMDAGAARLLRRGCRHLLVSGGHLEGEAVVNRLYSADGGYAEWRWDRLEGEYHGSGCTLAAACAVLLARDLPVKMAVRLAQAYTQDALARAIRPGRGQAIPRRVAPMPS